ncbi:MAG: monovalent cation/H+ antiporter complex subunit F [Acinetobacter sp.]|nr:monovalent cation/H+ antiporter complex subunit F [Acinetobacter sp.]
MSLLIWCVCIAIMMMAVSMLLCLYRLVVGPSVIDRLLALDTLFLNAIGVIILLSIYWSSVLLFESVLLIAMLGFVSTAALARYFTSGHVID